MVMYFIEKFPGILGLTQFGEISSNVQDLSISSSTISNESENQSSSRKSHYYNVRESISDILYEVSESENEAPLNQERHSCIEPTYRQHLQKYTQKMYT